MKNVHKAKKEQLNVRVSSIYKELIRIERDNLPNCASDGEALESLILRASTSPAAIKAISLAVLKEPLFAAAHHAFVQSKK